MGLEVIINNYWNQSSRGAISEGWVTGPAEQRLSSCHHVIMTLSAGHWSWHACHGGRLSGLGPRYSLPAIDPTVRGMSCPLLSRSRVVSAKPPATNTKLRDRQKTHIHTVFCERAKEFFFVGQQNEGALSRAILEDSPIFFCIDKERPLSKWCSNKLRLGGYTPGWWLIWSEF